MMNTYAFRCRSRCHRRERHCVAARDEAAPSKIAHQDFVDGCAVKVEVVDVLRQRELGNGHLIFDGTAISTWRRSPTICDGSCCGFMPRAIRGALIPKSLSSLMRSNIHVVSISLNLSVSGTCRSFGASGVSMVNHTHMGLFY
jgi:hypothetical protein